MVPPAVAIRVAGAEFADGYEYLGAGDRTFAHNGVVLPHRLRGVGGEVLVAVQLSACGDTVALLETDAQRAWRVAARREDEAEARAKARAVREATRRTALVKLGLV